MDTWGIVIFVAGTVAYFVFKKKPGFLFIAGIGVGIIIGAWWAMSIVKQVFGQYGF